MDDSKSVASPTGLLVMVLGTENVDGKTMVKVLFEDRVWYVETGRFYYAKPEEENETNNNKI